MEQTVLRDRYGRVVTYLRVSITDRCNLRCFYCLPRDCGLSRSAEQLDFDELTAVVKAGVALGISKIRITGGEPLVRPGVIEFVRTLRSLQGITDLALSTNGTLLGDHAAALKDAGLMRINVSLDSLRPTVFRAISGRNELDRVCAGISAARAAGLHPIKLNVVVMRGVNDDELPAILDFAAQQGAQARFIEYMPLGVGQRWEASYVSRAEILTRIRARLHGEPPRRQPGDTATYYALRNGGEVGVISPVSCRFCDLCNRLRLTADGKLRPCLTSEGEVDLRAAIRPRVSSAALCACFHAALAGRPQTGRYDTTPDRILAGPRPMAAIGG
ncbi:MAG: cyclic pyranopterin monophosphate synthase subunit MoaA [Deltaproteobacteria bacterium]|nr:cyclic pyranopterin monophosphate synthase subunit MoaA [Deltaproteobacteria bacterium]